MAVAPITPTQITEAGVAGIATGATTGNTSGGHSFHNVEDRTFIVATNTNGGSTARTLTIVTPGQVGGNDVADKVVSIAAGATVWIKVGSQQVYGTTVVMVPSNAELHYSVVYV